MNINYKQPQFELFPGQSTVGEDATKPRFFLANLTLTIENLVVLSILCIMLAVFAYSLGVERGKFVMAAQFNERRQTKPLMAEAPAVSVSPQVAEAKPAVQVAAGNAVTQQAPVSAVKPENTVPVLEQKFQKADPNFKFTVQVASYADEKFANRVAEDLGKKGYQTLVMKKGKYYILCIGKFNVKQEAVAMTAKLKSKYKDCLVRSM